MKSETSTLIFDAPGCENASRPEAGGRACKRAERKDPPPSLELSYSSTQASTDIRVCGTVCDDKFVVPEREEPVGKDHHRGLPRYLK